MIKRWEIDPNARPDKVISFSYLFMEGGELQARTTSTAISAARALRLTRVRESCINPSALHDRRCRSVYDLTHIDRHAPAMSLLTHTEKGSKPGTPDSSTMRSSRKEGTSLTSQIKGSEGDSVGGDAATAEGTSSVTTDVTKRRRQKGMSFEDQVDNHLKDRGSLEYLVWKHKQHAPRDAAGRMVIRPDLQRFYSSLTSPQRQLLHDKMATKVEILTKDIRLKFKRLKGGMDSNKVFHPNANAQRAHTLQLAELQRRLDIQKIEDETLEDMFNMQTDESIKEDEKNIVTSILKGTPFNAFGMRASVSSKRSKQKSNEEQLMSLSRKSNTTGTSQINKGKDAITSLAGRKLLGGTPPLILAKKDRDKLDNPIAYDERSTEPKIWAKAPEIHQGEDGKQRLVAEFETFKESGISEGSVISRANTAGNLSLVKQLTNEESGFRDYMRIHLANNRDGKQKQFGTSSASKRGLPPLPRTPAVLMMLSQKNNEERPPIGEFIHSRGSNDIASFGSRDGLAFENTFLDHNAMQLSHQNTNERSPEYRTDIVAENHEPLEGEKISLKDIDSHGKEGSPISARRSISQKTTSVGGEIAVSVGSRNNHSDSHSTSGIESLHPRLQEIWFVLEYSMQAKLEFLQKYAETTFAQMLPEVVNLMERLSFLIPSRELLLDLKRRNEGGEMLDLDLLFPPAVQEKLRYENSWKPIPSYREASDDELMDLERSVAYFSDRRLIYGVWFSDMVSMLTERCKIFLIRAKEDFNEIVTFRGAQYISACEKPR